MKITDVSIRPSYDNETSSFKGWAKITIDDAIIIKSIKMYETANKKTGNINRIIRFPQQRSFNGSSSLIINTIDPDIRNYFTNTIFSEYDRVTK